VSNPDGTLSLPGAVRISLVEDDAISFVAANAHHDPVLRFGAAGWPAATSHTFEFGFSPPIGLSGSAVALFPIAYNPAGARNLFFFLGVLYRETSSAHNSNAAHSLTSIAIALLLKAKCDLDLPGVLPEAAATLPEPSSWRLLASGCVFLIVIVGIRWRRRPTA